MNVQFLTWGTLTVLIFWLESLSLGPVLWCAVLWLFLSAQEGMPISSWSLCILVLASMIAHHLAKLEGLTVFSSQGSGRWNLVSWFFSSFTHQNTVHLAGNLFAFHSVLQIYQGRLSEPLMIALTALMIFQINLFRVAAGACLYLRPVRSVGASGWIFGWFGFTAISVKHVTLGFFGMGSFSLQESMAVILLVMMVLSQIDVFSGIDHGAHAWGFFVGGVNGTLFLNA